ncbi:hypothetical protein OXX80_003686 [Metschnikowia pulcherrima]
MFFQNFRALAVALMMIVFGNAQVLPRLIDTRNFAPQKSFFNIKRSFYDPSQINSDFGYTEQFPKLKSQMTTLQTTISDLLSSGYQVSVYQVDHFRDQINELTYSVYLQRAISTTQRNELLKSADTSYSLIADFLAAKMPNKYPTASEDDRLAFREMNRALTSKKNDVLSLLYGEKEDSKQVSISIDSVMERVRPIRKNLSMYYTEYDSDYRRAVVLENFISDVAAFIITSPDPYRIPIGVNSILAQQSKGHLEESRDVLSHVSCSETGSSEFESFIKIFKAELRLLAKFELVNGKISLEIDSLLRQIRDEFHRLELDSQYIEELVILRMTIRFQRTLNSVDHVLHQIGVQRILDGIRPGQKPKSYIRFDTPLAFYLLSFTDFHNEFLAWNLKDSNDKRRVDEMIRSGRLKLKEAKALGKVLPKQSFWDDF